MLLVPFQVHTLSNVFLTLNADDKEVENNLFWKLELSKNFCLSEVNPVMIEDMFLLKSNTDGTTFCNSIFKRIIRFHVPMLHLLH